MFDYIFKGAPLGNKNAAGPHKGYHTGSTWEPEGGRPPANPRRINNPIVLRQTHAADTQAKAVAETLPPSKPPPRASDIHQPGVNSVDDLFRQAQESKPEFDKHMAVLAKSLGPEGSVASPDNYMSTMASFENGSSKGLVLMIGPPKEYGKTSKKISGYAKKHGIPPAAQVGDMLRATIAVDRISDIPHALSLVGKSGFVLGREPKVRIASGTAAGYRDVLTNVKMANGHIVEIQVNTKKMLLAKDKAHKYYNQQIDIEKKATSDGRMRHTKNGTPEYLLSPSEKKEYARLEALQVKIYAKAWKESGGA